MTQEAADERSSAEGIGIGLGLGVGGPLTAFIAVLILDPARDWTFAVYAGGALLGAVGVTGALMDFSKLREDDMYEALGIAAFMAGLATVLIGLTAVDVLTGVPGGIANALGLLSLLFAVVSAGMALGRRLGSPRAPRALPDLAGSAKEKRGMPFYEAATLVLAVLGTVAGFIGAFNS